MKRKQNWIPRSDDKKVCCKLTLFWKKTGSFLLFSFLCVTFVCISHLEVVVACHLHTFSVHKLFLHVSCIHIVCMYRDGHLLLFKLTIIVVIVGVYNMAFFLILPSSRWPLFFIFLPTLNKPLKKVCPSLLFSSYSWSLLVI